MNGRIDGRCFCQTVTGSCFGPAISRKTAPEAASISALCRSVRRSSSSRRDRTRGLRRTGYLFYVDEKGRLAMQAFDPDAGHVTGDVRVIAGAVGFQPSLYWGAFAVSASGTVVVNPTSAVSQSVLTWYDRGGKELGIVGRPAMIYNPSLSPDGQQLAADISDPMASNVDVWTFDLGAGTSGRFTFGAVGGNHSRVGTRRKSHRVWFGGLRNGGQAHHRPGKGTHHRRASRDDGSRWEET